MHVTMHNTADQTFWIFFMEVEDLGIWSSASIRACIFPSLSSLLWLHEVNDGGGSLFRLCFQWFFSLWHLDISYEYLINQRDNGDDWPKIAHFPYIRIDSNVIAVLWIQNNFCPGTCLALMFWFLLLIGLFHC